MNKPKDLYEPIAPEDPVNSSVFFDSVLKRLNIDLDDPKRQLFLQWDSFIGENFKGHAKCNGVGDKTVFVVCDHPSYVAMFKMNSKEVLKKIQTTFPELGIEKIAVKLATR